LQSSRNSTRISGKTVDPALLIDNPHRSCFFNSWANPKSIVDLADGEVFYPFIPGSQERVLRELGNTLPSRGSDYLAKWRRLRLTPLLYHEVIRHGWQEVFSPWLLHELKTDYARALRTASRQEVEIMNVLRHLQREGIEVILLKGADLRHRLYHDPALRPMIDVDLLISLRMVPRARQVLHGLGYGLHHPSGDNSTRLKEKFGNELCFAPPPGKNLMIDLHWEIEGAARLYRISFANLSVTTTNYYGIAVKILVPEHLLIHLCLHLLNHPRYKPGDLPLGIQIVDLVWALDRLPINWPRFLEEVFRLRCALAVSYPLRGLSALVPGLVPANVMASLAKSRSSWHEEPVLWLWYGLGCLYRQFPWLENYLPRLSPLRRIWVR
jgi:hypothetical protein